MKVSSLPHLRNQRSVIATIVVCMFASGCTTNTYVMTDGMKTSLKTTDSANNQNATGFAGDLEQAITDVDAQRNAYFDALTSRTKQRNVLNGTLITLTAAALYDGISTAGRGTNRAVANLGTLAGGAYAVNSYSNSPNTELAHLNAANDLTCLIMKTRPWLVKAADFSQFTGTHITQLSDAIDKLDNELQSQAAKSGSSTAFMKAHGFERQMLYNARATLRKAHNFKGYVESAGFQLRQEAVLVANNTNLEVHRLQPDLINPSSTLSGLRSVSQSFREIKPLEVPSSDDAKEDKDEDNAPATTSGLNTSGSSSALTQINIEKNVKTTSDFKAESDLGKAADKLNELLKEQSNLLAQHKKATQAITQKTKAQIADLNKRLDDISIVISKIKDGKEANLQLTVIPFNTNAATELATDLSDLLKQMRIVNTTLTRAYSLKPYVRNIAQCQRNQADDFGFTFDDDSITLQPGQSFTVAVKGGVGVPQIWLSGARGTSLNEMPTFTTSIDGGIARATLTLPPKALAGDLYIMAVDGSGKRQDQIKVNVLVPKLATK